MSGNEIERQATYLIKEDLDDGVLDFYFQINTCKNKRNQKRRKSINKKNKKIKKQESTKVFTIIHNLYSTKART